MENSLVEVIKLLLIGMNSIHIYNNSSVYD